MSKMTADESFTKSMYLNLKEANCKFMNFFNHLKFMLIAWVAKSMRNSVLLWDICVSKKLVILKCGWLVVTPFTFMDLPHLDEAICISVVVYLVVPYWWLLYPEDCLK